MTSVVLVLGLMPGVALAAGDDATTSQRVTDGEKQYNSINVNLGNKEGSALDVEPADNAQPKVDVTGNVDATGGQKPSRYRSVLPAA